MNIIFMNVLLERIGFQLMVLCICAGASLSDYFLEVNTQSHPLEFELVKEERGVQLYERWYEIKPGQLAREIKAVCQLRSSHYSAIALLKNEAVATDWNKGSQEVRILPMEENRWTSYIRYDLPWPLDDQDCVLSNSLQFSSPDAVIVDFITVKHKVFPPIEGVHRIDFVKGKWVFKKAGAGIMIEYYITTTPSTILPRYLTDPIIRNNLISTIDQFRNLLEK